MEHFKLLVLYCSLSLFFISISIPLIYKKIPRNKYYGFRTRRALSDDTIWYDVNAYFGKLFARFSVIQFFATIIIYKFFSDKNIFIIVENIFLAVGTTTVIIQSFIHLKKISI